MKKGIILTVLLITAIGYISCDKPEKVKDYRDKWVGRYECSCDWWEGMLENPVCIDITAKGDHILGILRNDTKENYDVCVQTNGYFLDYSTPSVIYGYFIGDTIFIQIHVPYSRLLYLKGEKR